MPHARIKWGILGTSPISTTMVQAIRESEIGEVIAIGSRSTETAYNFAHTFSIPKYYASHQEVLNDKEVDVVYIGLPNHLHKEWIIRCAQAGKHILCEKPFVTNINDAYESMAAVNAAGVFCMEALMYRCHPLIAKLNEIIMQQTIGEIKFINAVYMADIANLANPIASGSILNLGCYPISLVRLLTGASLGKPMAEPTEIRAVGRLNIKGRDNQASVLLRFENDIMAAVSTADDMGMYYQFEMYGTRGHLRFISNPWMPAQETNRFCIYQNGQDAPVEINVVADKPLYTYQIDAVNQHILSGKKENDSISWQDSLGNMAVLHTWLQQVQSHVQLAEGAVG